MKKITFFFGVAILFFATACKSEKAPAETVNVIPLQESVSVVSDSTQEAEAEDEALAAEAEQNAKEMEGVGKASDSVR